MLISGGINRRESQCSFIGDIVKRTASRTDRRVFRWIAVAIFICFWALVYRMVAA
jgi:hypothetical protein